MFKKMNFKKTVLYSLVATFLVIGLCGCSGTKANKEDSNKSENPTSFDKEIVEVDNVTIAVSDVTPTSATVIVTDNNETPHVYEAWYIIQKQNGENWENLVAKKEMTFPEIGYLVDDNKQVKFEINWEAEYGSLETGTYRIIKSVERKYIAVNFNI